MNRRDFMRYTAVTAVTPFATRLWPVYMPQINRAQPQPAKGWGTSTCTQLYDTPEFGLKRILTLLDPIWWHDWSYLYPGAIPSVYQSAYYTGNKTNVDAMAKGWNMCFWGNEPESEFDGESPAVTAVTVRKFRDANPHVKVYGLGCQARIADHMGAYANAGGPQFDGFHFHFYAHAASEWVTAWDNFRTIAGDKPIVLTEFGGWGDYTPLAGHLAIMDTVRDTLSRDNQLQACSWFCARPFQASWFANSLLDYLGNVTELGKHWLSLR